MTKEIPRRNDMPVTVKMFNEFRAELNAKMDAGFAATRGEVGSLRGEFESLRGEFKSLRGEFESSITSLRGELHSIKLLIETQTAQNAIALDGVRHALAEVAELRELHSQK